MPTLSDMQIDPATGMLQNPGDFTPGQMAEAMTKGRLTFQGYQNAIPKAAKPADNTGDVAAQQQAGAANDLRYGTNAQGAPAGPLASIVPQAPPLNLGTTTISAPPAPGAAAMQPQDGAPQYDPRDRLLGNLQMAASAPAGGPGGPTKLDKAYLDTLKGQAAALDAHARESVEMHKDAIDTFKQESDRRATELQVAGLLYQDQLKDDLSKQNALAADAKDAQRRSLAEISKLEAQGINPNHYWQSMATGQKIGAAIAIGLGTFAAHPLGPRGGASENVALGIINNAIAADIDAQKANLAKSMELAKRRGEVEEKGFNQQEALLRAERDSHLTAWNVAIGQIQRQVDLNKGNAQVAQAGQQMIDEARARADAGTARYNEEIYKIQKRYDVQPGGGGAATAQKRLDQIRELSAKLVSEGKPLDEAIRMATGVVGLVGGPEGGIVKPGAKGEEDKATVLVNGKPMRAVNEERAKAFATFNEAYPEERRLHQVLTDAWAKQDWGRYQQARAAYIELAPRVYGFARGPSGAQAGEGSHDDASIKATVAGQLPEMNRLVNDPRYWGGTGTTMLKSVGEHLSNIYENMWSSTFQAPSPGNPLGLERK